MNKKILIFGVLAALMLVAISFATVVSSNTNTTVKKKESPLFGIRKRQAIREQLQDLKESIKARFIGDRLFFLPFEFIDKITDYRFFTYGKSGDCTEHQVTCETLDC
jgi:hypothetical protein